MNILDATVAIFSEDRKYRYLLRRRTGFGDGICLFLMLNPSTADEEHNDNTVSRCIDYSNRWGYGELLVCNIFAFRATDPKVMKKEADPVGPANDDTIVAATQVADRVILAWGVHGSHRQRSSFVTKELLDVNSLPVYHLGLTKGGEPYHPLMLKKIVEPKRYVLE